MYYTGIDLHKKTSFITTVDENGHIVARANLVNNESDILNYFRGLDGDTRIVIESTASWYWIYDLLTDSGFDVVISNGVINLIPDKESALAEIFRVLKPGGRLMMADQVSSGSVQKDIKARLANWFK